MKKTVLTRKAHGAVSRGLRGLCLIVAAWACTAQGSSVFDDAMAWWKFDRGGADGTVATKAQLGDARDSSLHQPTTLYGKSGGPIWSEMDVRLPYQNRTVHGTALHFPCETRMNGTTPQCWYTSLAFSDLYSHGSELTIVARVRIESNGIQAADGMIWNNAFNWGGSLATTYGSAMGIIKWNSGKGPGITYGPYGFIGRNTFGNLPADKVIPMRVGEWYDVAYLISEETVDSVRYDVVTFVVGDASGIRTQTMRKISNRVAEGATTTHAKMSAMSHNTGWLDYNAAALGKNTSDNFKNFEGWIHQLAVWKRKLTIDEVKEAFGRPADASERDIYSEAVNWIRFDKDIDGNGKVTADEVRDMHHWNTPSNGQPVVVSQAGPFGGPIWTNMTVDLPGRGVSVKSPCLYFPIATNVTQNATTGTVYSAWPTTLRFDNMMRAGSYTIMARIYPLWQPAAIPYVCSYFYNNGLDWAGWAGSEFGLSPNNDRKGNSFCPVMTVGHSSYYATSLQMYTNNWYDIAFSIKDNGVDANGKTITDTAIVAIQDVAKGFRYQAMNIGTNAYTVFAGWGQRAMLGSEGTYAMTPFYYPDYGTQHNYGNAVKSFNGMIHEVVVWNRALTTNEIKAAFSHPCNMVMQAGTADGSASEFAGTTGAYDCNVDTTGTVWRAISNILNADHPELTLRFTPATHNVKLIHYLHLKSADVGTADGQKARMLLTLNEQAVATEREIGAFEDVWIILPRRSLKEGENVLKIAYGTGGTAASFALDSVEITGAWQMGKLDGYNGEFSQEGDSRVTPNYVVGDRNLKHIARAVTSGWHNNYHSFYVPAYIATNHAFRFTSSVSNYNDPALTNEAHVCTIDLNGTVKYKMPFANPPPVGTIFSFEIERGELKPGWNTLHYSYTGTITPAWASFDFFKLEISDYHTGLIMLIR